MMHLPSFASAQFNQSIDHWIVVQTPAGMQALSKWQRYMHGNMAPTIT
jgi:hypothetical protein